MDLPESSKEEDFVDDGVSEKLGKARLGSTYFLENVGVTLILASSIILIVALLVIAVYCCAKKCNWTPEKKEKL